MFHVHLDAVQHDPGKVEMQKLFARLVGANGVAVHTISVPSLRGTKGTKIPSRPWRSDLGFRNNAKLRKPIDRGERGALKRSFRPVSPSHNSHRSGATHVPQEDGEGDSAGNRPYRPCSSLPAVPLIPPSIRCAACKCGCRDDP